MLVFVFFFMQKTSNEIRISDWSSDVCSFRSAILAGSRVAIIGLGGVGSLLVELLARLGVGQFVLVDPDRVDPTNVPRLVDATPWDAMAWLVDKRRPEWLRTLEIGRASCRERVCQYV